jgi:tRNA nucleotidyltransferase/poly(A) polymerase
MTDLLDALLGALEGAEAWLVGGAVRDELLGRPVLDVDVACREPAQVARRFARGQGGAPFPLSERHGAWRVVLEGDRTVDFTPLPDGIDADLATRDFTLNAMARPLGGSEVVDPYGGRDDIAARTIRAVSAGVFEADPLRLLRAVRLEDELGFRVDPDTERLVRRDAGLVRRPARERILGELERLSVEGYRRLDELGLLAPLGGSPELLDRAGAVDSPEFRLVCVFAEKVERFPVSRALRRYGRTLRAASPPPDESPRAIHRFRRETEPWALDALAYLGAAGLGPAVEEARRREPAEPLVRGDELGLPPGPEIGRLLEEIAEERAAGTIATKAEALEYARSRGAGTI